MELQKNINSSEMKNKGIECVCESKGGKYGNCRNDGRLKEILNILSECKINENTILSSKKKILNI